MAPPRDPAEGAEGAAAPEAGGTDTPPTAADEDAPVAAGATAQDDLGNNPHASQDSRDTPAPTPALAGALAAATAEREVPTPPPAASDPPGMQPGGQGAPHLESGSATPPPQDSAALTRLEEMITSLAMGINARFDDLERTTRGERARIDAVEAKIEQLETVDTTKRLHALELTQTLATDAMTEISTLRTQVAKLTASSLELEAASAGHGTAITAATQLSQEVASLRRKYDELCARARQPSEEEVATYTAAVISSLEAMGAISAEVTTQLDARRDTGALPSRAAVERAFKFAEATATENRRHHDQQRERLQQEINNLTTEVRSMRKGKGKYVPPTPPPADGSSGSHTGDLDELRTTTAALRTDFDALLSSIDERLEDRLAAIAAANPAILPPSPVAVLNREIDADAAADAAATMAALDRRQRNTQMGLAAARESLNTTMEALKALTARVDRLVAPAAPAIPTTPVRTLTPEAALAQSAAAAARGRAIAAGELAVPGSGTSFSFLPDGRAGPPFLPLGGVAHDGFAQASGEPPPDWGATSPSVYSGLNASVAMHSQPPSATHLTPGMQPGMQPATPVTATGCFFQASRDIPTCDGGGTHTAPHKIVMEADRMIDRVVEHDPPPSYTAARILGSTPATHAQRTRLADVMLWINRLHRSVTEHIASMYGPNARVQDSAIIRRVRNLAFTGEANEALVEEFDDLHSNDHATTRLSAFTRTLVPFLLGEYTDQADAFFRVEQNSLGLYLTDSPFVSLIRAGQQVFRRTRALDSGREPASVAYGVHDAAFCTAITRQLPPVVIKGIARGNPGTVAALLALPLDELMTAVKSLPVTPEVTNTLRPPPRSALRPPPKPAAPASLTAMAADSAAPAAAAPAADPLPHAVPHAFMAITAKTMPIKEMCLCVMDQVRDRDGLTPEEQKAAETDFNALSNAHPAASRATAHAAFKSRTQRIVCMNCRHHWQGHRCGKQKCEKCGRTWTFKKECTPTDSVQQIAAFHTALQKDLEENVTFEGDSAMATCC